MDEDKRLVWCRACGTILDPYFVLRSLASIDRRAGERLAALQELERREAVRDGERKARAAVRRHRYAAYAYKNQPERCAVCGGQRDLDVHATAKGAR